MFCMFSCLLKVFGLTEQGDLFLLVIVFFLLLFVSIHLRVIGHLLYHLVLWNVIERIALGHNCFHLCPWFLLHPFWKHSIWCCRLLLLNYHLTEQVLPEHLHLCIQLLCIQFHQSNLLQGDHQKWLFQSKPNTQVN